MTHPIRGAGEKVYFSEQDSQGPAIAPVDVKRVKPGASTDGAPRRAACEEGVLCMQLSGWSVVLKSVF